MNLEEKSINELKAICFDINQAILKNQHDYQVVVSVLNKKLEAEQSVPLSEVKDATIEP
jgi:hypothetical protein